MKQERSSAEASGARLCITWLRRSSARLPPICERRSISSRAASLSSSRSACLFRSMLGRSSSLVASPRCGRSGLALKASATSVSNFSIAAAIRQKHSSSEAIWSSWGAAPAIGRAAASAVVARRRSRLTPRAQARRLITTQSGHACSARSGSRPLVATWRLPITSISSSVKSSISLNHGTSGR